MSATGVMITAEGTTIAQLARTTNPTQIVGDSGGGWSFANQAWGIHSGYNNVWEYFTPVRVAEAQLSVVVKTS